MALNDDTEERVGGIHFLHNNRTEKLAVRVRVIVIEHADALRDALIAVDACWGKVT